MSSTKRLPGTKNATAELRMNKNFVEMRVYPINCVYPINEGLNRVYPINYLYAKRKAVASHINGLYEMTKNIAVAVYFMS